ncbi:epididymal-specific lipocalin-6 [Equus asinus]|uniref:Lipocalin/cytosolic fatty-acid binding domain-containing protein n=1 Tax=Equus asinus TaxID=9793 RepID=A0A8C4MDU0_EQUAS|nr:epididymal-specific lipocalin-6 [Equus quagga]
MRGVHLAALLALLSVPQAQALWLGRLNPNQLLGSWYVLAKASGEKDFAVEKATKNIEGVVVTLTPENNLKMLSSRHRLERCDLNVVELLRQASGWVFENPALGVVEFRVLSTNFRDYAVVFTQLEFADEAFSTVELYSRSELASQEAVHLFAKWSKGLGFLSQQQAQLQRDLTCAHKAFQVSFLPMAAPGPLQGSPSQWQCSTAGKDRGRGASMGESGSPNAFFGFQ